MSGPSVPDARVALRAWVRERNPGLADGALADDTPLIEARYLTSLQLSDLLLLIEELRAATIEPSSLRPGVFRDIDTICATFFEQETTT